MTQPNYASQMVVKVQGHPGIYRKGGTKVGADGKGGLGGSYQVRYRHHGKLTQRSFRTLSEAKRFKGKVNAGEAQPTSRQPFRSYAEEWIDSYTGRTSKGVSQTTRDAYRDALKRFAVPFFGTRPMDEIGPKLVRDYIVHLEGQGLTRNSVRKYLAPVKALFATAAADELITRNPASDIRVTTPDTRVKTPMWLTPAQTKALLAKIPAEHGDLVYLMASTGLRISEALNLRWQDLTGGQLTVTKSKTTTGERTIPVSPETMRRLTKRRTEADYDRDSDLVFPTRVGTQIDARNWRRRIFTKAAKAAGTPWATPHKLRHGMASLMAADGRGAPEIAVYLGHSDGGVLALRTYIHAEPTTVDFIDGALA
jgi:integrase